MKKELYILSVVVAFSLLTYYLVEPFAHGVMHPHVESKDFVYDGSSDINEVNEKIVKLNEDLETEKSAEKPDAKKIAGVEADISKSKARLAVKQAFWSDVKRISALKGDIEVGEAQFVNCTSCHIPNAPAMGGVTPPSLVNAGAMYDRAYLIGLIKNPAMVSNVDHKFSDARPHPMDSVKYMVSSDEDIVNVVDYMLASAPKAETITPKMAFEDTCGRCHNMRYKKWTTVGETENFKHKQETLAFEIKQLDYQDGLKTYMGKLPPDLSMYIRSRGHHYISTFVEDPQQLLLGTSMPRVGVNAQTAEKVVAYLEEAGDPTKAERNRVGMYVMIYMIFFILAAYLWKKQVWKDLH
ncbi:cytochrome c1 [Sulfurimonas sp. MAG313]|nr:c-type cytochrome [Sulfurimonas sp. MAG313]MDF1880260.1 cytochrome c1 [Sulfurimonas sp. MAG313]